MKIKYDLIKEDILSLTILFVLLSLTISASWYTGSAVLGLTPATELPNIAFNFMSFGIGFFILLGIFSLVNRYTEKEGDEE